MTTGQGAEIHFNDLARNARGVRLSQPVRGDQRIFQSQRDRQAFPVTGSTQRHPVAADRYVSRPVHQVIHCPDPSVSGSNLILNLGSRPARNGQNVAGVIGSTLIVRDFPHNLRREITAQRGNLFSFCSHYASSPTRPNGHPPQQTPDPHAQLLRRVSHSRAPNRANSSRASNPPGTPARLLTPSQEAA